MTDIYQTIMLYKEFKSSSTFQIARFLMAPSVWKFYMDITERCQFHVATISVEIAGYSIRISLLYRPSTDNIEIRENKYTQSFFLRDLFLR